MTILETKDLRKFYGSGDTQVKALDGVDMFTCCASRNARFSNRKAGDILLV